MKTIYSLLIFFSLFTLNAQTASILEHNWTIEKIVSADQTVFADLNEEGVYDQLIFFEESNIPNFYNYHAFGDCEGVFDLDEIAQDFYINYFYCAITWYGSNISQFFNGVYIFQEGGLTPTTEGDVFGPFDYSFREEDDLIFLDITNPEGSIATFWASTLSNTNFDKTKFSFFPNPVANELHIESEQAKIDQIEIYNLNGKQVLDVNFQKDQPIDVSSLAKGMYLVKIKTESGSLTKKLIKE